MRSRARCRTLGVAIEDGHDLLARNAVVGAEQAVVGIAAHEAVVYHVVDIATLDVPGIDRRIGKACLVLVILASKEVSGRAHLDRGSRGTGAQGIAGLLKRVGEGAARGDHGGSSGIRSVNVVICRIESARKHLSCGLAKPSEVELLEIRRQGKLHHNNGHAILRRRKLAGKLPTGEVGVHLKQQVGTGLLGKGDAGGELILNGGARSSGLRARTKHADAQALGILHGARKLLGQCKREVSLGEVAQSRACMLAVMGGVECNLERDTLRGTRRSSGDKSLGKCGVGRLALGRHHVVFERAGAGELGVGRCIGSGGVLRLCRLGGLAGLGGLRWRRRIGGPSRLDRVCRLTGVGGVRRRYGLAGLGRIHGSRRIGGLGRVYRRRRFAWHSRLTRTSRVLRRCGLVGALRPRDTRGLAGQCATIRARRHSRVARPRCRCSPLHIVLCRSASDRHTRLHLIGVRQRHDRGARNAQRGHEAPRTQGELDTSGQLSSWFHLPHPFQSSRAAPARRPGHTSHMRQGYQPSRQTGRAKTN